MFKQILVPVDGSMDGWIAADQAIEIAREEGGQILGLFVADVRLLEAPYWTSFSSDGDTIDMNYAASAEYRQIEKNLQKQGQLALDNLENRCIAAGISCQNEFVEGIVTREILAHAQNADLVVMGRRGHGAKWAGPLLGSTFEAVARHAPKPVLATQSEARVIRRILVAYDSSERSRDALKVAARWGTATQREIILLTVDDGRAGREEASKEGATYFKQSGVPVKQIFVPGHVAKAILHVADVEACDLIMLGAYGHSRFVQAFFGSTVDDVLHGAKTPVLITR